MKKIQAQKLCDVAENMRAYFHRDVFRAEIMRGTTSTELTGIRFSRNENGRPTRKIIECNENGVVCYYDRRVELNVVALCVEDRRVTV